MEDVDNVIGLGVNKSFIIGNRAKHKKPYKRFTASNAIGKSN